ncbi:Oligopeptide ABC transporter, periplasmic oligopeptide-binding protein OppA [Carnobacterium antarcticum]|nr:Oligopeptide ABC transporter, periplasmic oligopeptide-binding protein OppA [Carnobacterium sp. CP1]
MLKEESKLAREREVEEKERENNIKKGRTTMKKQKNSGMRKWSILMGLAAFLFLAACGNNAEKEGAQVKAVSQDILYIGMTNPPDNFSPINAAGVSARWAQRFFYDALLDMPDALTFTPRLADSFETEDNQNYTIKLNPDANWSDGTPVTAEDVVFTYNLIADPEVETTRGVAVASLEGVTSSGKLEEGRTEIPNLVAVDDKTVTLKTETPVDPNYLKEFLAYGIFILPKHVWEDTPKSELANASFVTQPEVTSGPYTFVEYAKDSHIELTANPDYYRGEPEIKEVFLKIMNGTNLVTELQSGGLHMNASGGIGEVPTQELKTVEAIEGLEVNVQPSLTVQMMPINTEVFKDKYIRQALAHAINRNQIVESLLGGQGEIVESIYTSVSPYKNEELEPIAYDPELAKELITKSDFDMSQEIEIVVPVGNKVREQSAVLIQQDLEAVGFKVKLSNFDFPTVMEKGRSGDFDLMMYGYALNIDPDVTNYVGPEGVSNYSNYENPKNTALLEAGLAETDPEKRKAIYDEAQEIWQDDMFIVPLYSALDIVVKNETLNGGITEFWPGSLTDVEAWTLQQE